MIRLCNFIEYGCNNGVSIKDSACQQSYPEKQKIVSYLKNEGKCIMVQAKIAKDRLIKCKQSIINFNPRPREEGDCKFIQ